MDTVGLEDSPDGPVGLPQDPHMRTGKIIQLMIYFLAVTTITIIAIILRKIWRFKMTPGTRVADAWTRKDPPPPPEKRKKQM